MKPTLDELAASLVARLGSQEKLAEVLGTAQSTVSGWIAGAGATDVAELALLRLTASLADREKILGAFLGLRVNDKLESFELVRSDFVGTNLVARRIETVFLRDPLAPSESSAKRKRDLDEVKALVAETAAFDLVVDGDYLVFRRLEDRFLASGSERTIIVHLNEEDLRAGLVGSWRR